PRSHRARVERAGVARRRSVLRLGDDARRRIGGRPPLRGRRRRRSRGRDDPRAARRGGRRVSLRGMLPLMTSALYPLFLDLEGRDVLVVGGGAVAERKVSDLLDAGASVRIVAKDATPALVALAASGDLALEER